MRQPLTLLERAQIKIRRLDEIELGTRRTTRLDHLAKGGAVLLGQLEEKISAATNLVQPCGIQLDRRFVLDELARERLEIVVGAVVELLQAGERRIHALNRGEQPLHGGEALEDAALVVTLDRLRDPTRQLAKLLGVLESSRLVLQSNVLTVDELRALDLLHDVPQVIGALLRIRSAAAQVGDVAPRHGERLVRIAYSRRMLRRAGKCVQNPTLRVAVQQRLGLVLPVHVDEQSPDLGEDSSTHGRAIHPGTRATRGGDLPLEHHERLFRIDAALIEQRRDLGTIRNVEHSFDRGAISTGANEVNVGPLAKK